MWAQPQHMRVIVRALVNLTLHVSTLFPGVRRIGKGEMKEAFLIFPPEGFRSEHDMI